MPAQKWIGQVSFAREYSTRNYAVFLFSRRPLPLPFFVR